MDYEYKFKTIILNSFPEGMLNAIMKKDDIKLNINLHNSKFLTGLKTGVSKVSAYAVIIMSIMDAVKYQKNEDYDALAATVAMIGVNVLALLVTSGMPLVVFVTISSIVYAIAMLTFVDSAFESYLKRSLFYENKMSKNKYIKKYPATFLLESTNKNSSLKAINSDGFTKTKEIFDFIGKNYEKNEIYFDTGLKNELSFLNAALYGYKLEITDFNSHQRVKIKTGLEISMYVNHAVEIPKDIAEDIDFTLYLVGDKINKNFKLKDLVNNGSSYAFNFFPEKDPYFDLSLFPHSLKVKNHTSYIIIKSSKIDMKYKVVFRDNDKITPNSHIEIDSLEQVSFDIEDEEIIEGK